MTNTALMFGNPGVVQSYDSSSGEGVVISDRTGDIVRVTENNVRAAKLTTLRPGAQIRYSVKSGRSTLLIGRIYEVDGIQTHWARPFVISMAKPITIDGKIWIEGKVKSFAATRKFAFVASEGLPPIFVGADLLDIVRPPLQVDEHVEVECGLSTKGISAIRLRRCM